MKDIYELDITPHCNIDNTVVGNNYRFTILTPYLIRMEYDEQGIFEDRATQTVINRDFSKQSFKVIDKENSLEIITEVFHVIYDKKEFSRNGLIVKVKSDYMVYESIWHYNDPARNLKGTARTLDGADGMVKLEDGILSRDGLLS